MGDPLALNGVSPLHAVYLRQRRLRVDQSLGSPLLFRRVYLSPTLVAGGYRWCPVVAGGVGIPALSSDQIL